MYYFGHAWYPKTCVKNSHRRCPSHRHADFAEGCTQYVRAMPVEFIQAFMTAAALV